MDNTVNTRAPQGTIINDDKLLQTIPNWQTIVAGIFDDNGHSNWSDYKLYDTTIDKSFFSGNYNLFLRITNENISQSFKYGFHFKAYTDINSDYPYIDDFQYRKSITIPKQQLNSNLKIESLITSSSNGSQFTSKSVLIPNTHALVTPTELNSYFNDHGCIIYNADWNNDNLVTTNYAPCYFNSKVVDFSNKVVDLQLKPLQAYILVVTDEFNDKIACPLVNDIDEYDSFTPHFFTSWDYKDNRPMTEYFPEVYNSHGIVGQETGIWSYSNFIHNTTKQESYICPIKWDLYWGDNDWRTSFDVGVDGRHYSSSGATQLNPYSLCVKDHISNLNYYMNDYNFTFLKNKTSKRVYTLVAAKLASMPYGRPTTLDSTIYGAFTHINNTLDIGKEIKYLIVNMNYAFANHHEYHGYVWKKTPNIPDFMRAAIPIPEEGFKPGHIYMIYNKPGTKLFKEWDEANGTTRAGEEDYVVDESCFEIEEIPM